MKPFFRKLHRWLGLAMALQIIAWMASGLYFAVFPIETIRGEHLTREGENLEATSFVNLVPVDVAWNNAIAGLDDGAAPAEFSLQKRQGKTWYRISGTVGTQTFTRMVDGVSGQVAAPLDAAEARDIATASLRSPGLVEAVEWVEETRPGSEIRGRQLPVWRVSFSEPESLNLYIDPWTAEIAARRTTRWRVFDFLWMLHILDFEARDDFNTPLLQIAAGAGLLVALSGLIFWAMTTRLFRGRRGRVQARAGSLSRP